MARITKAKLKAVVAEAGKAIPTAKGPSRVSGKTSTVITLLKSKQGATIPELMVATGWQSHSVRGFLAGALRKRHGLEPVSEKRDGEPRRYRAR